MPRRHAEPRRTCRHAPPRKLRRYAEDTPTRDLVVFSDKAWDGSEEALRKVARDYYANGSYPLSQQSYTWENGAWQVLEP